MEFKSGNIVSNIIAFKKHAVAERQYHQNRRICLYIWAITAVGVFMLTVSYPGYSMTGLRTYIDPSNTRDWRGINNARKVWSTICMILGFPCLLNSAEATSLSAGFKILGLWILSGPVTFVAAIIWPTTNVFSSDWTLFYIWAMLGSALYVVGTAKPPPEPSSTYSQIN